MKKTIILVAALLVAITSFAQKNPLEGYTTAPSGVKYKFLKQNPTGQPVLMNDLIIGRFTIKFGDSIINNGAKMQPQPIVKVDSTAHIFKGDLIDGLLMMKKGEACTFAMERDSILKVFNNNLPPYFKSGDYAYWTIDIVDIKTAEQQKEEEAKMKAEQENKMAQTKALADSLSVLEPGIIKKAIKDYDFPSQPVNGIYFKKTHSEKNATKIESGDKVKINYAGRLTNGKLFDTSIQDTATANNLSQPGRKYEPIEFNVGRGMMIRGFEEAVKMLRAGESARILLPSKMAYGDRGAGDIMPCTPIIFDIQVVDVQKAPKEAIRPDKVVPLKNANSKAAKTAVKTIKTKK